MKERITAVLLALAVLSALFTPAAAAADNASKPLAGQYISIIGDSISTYHG